MLLVAAGSVAKSADEKKIIVTPVFQLQIVMSEEGQSSPSPPQDEVKSSDSVPTSEEYEMLKDHSPSPVNGGLVVRGEADLELSLKECLEENSHPKNETIADLSTVISNENLLEDPDHTIFHNVVYLGAVTVHNPKDEAAIQEHMSVMNQASSVPLAVTVSVPRSSTDSVVLREAATRTRVASFRIHKIIFFARGQVTSPESTCFAFTCAQGDTAQTTVVQCHVFR